MSAATKWTPGPWKVHQERVGEFLVLAPDGMAVAEGVGNIFDAQVLAAAPTLYAELRGIGIVHEGESEPCYCGMPMKRHMAYCLRVRATLARAEGR